jgi:CheY-like chemotaxis protein
MKPAVLIVDDEFGLAEVVAEMLADRGYEVGTAINGVIGLERIAQKRPDLVLLDNFMPIMGGLEMARIMRADQDLASIPVVMMTSLPQALPRDTSLFDAMLHKPFTPEALLSTLRRLLPGAK